MRLALLALALALASACSIPGDRFFAPGGGSDAGGGDTPPDMPPGAALRHGWIVDFTAAGGIFRVDKAADGRISLASPTPTATTGGSRGFASKDGSHLYVFNAASPPVVENFKVQADFSLTRIESVPMPCTALFATLHPSGTFAIVACSNGFVEVMTIASDGHVAGFNGGMIGQSPTVPAFTPDGKCVYIPDLNGAQVIIGNVDLTNGQVAFPNAMPTPSLPFGIAIRPDGKAMYVGTQNGMVQAFTVNADCTVQPIGAPLPIGPNTQQLVVDPPGTHLFVTGTEVFAFDIINAAGNLAAVSGSPFFAAGNTLDGAVMDPAVPDSLYITARGFGGTFQATIDAQGKLAMGSMAQTGTGGTFWFILTP